MNKHNTLANNEMEPVNHKANKHNTLANNEMDKIRQLRLRLLEKLVVDSLFQIFFCLICNYFETSACFCVCIFYDENTYSPFKTGCYKIRRFVQVIKMLANTCLSCFFAL